jgi:hypothetical protein
LVVKREYNQWKPQAGLARKELPDAGVPAAPAGGRLLQMRKLAQEFTGHSIDRDAKRWSAPAADSAVPLPGGKTGVVDGAVRALMSSAGTDPEVLLLVEAKETAGKLRWEYACGRFSDLELRQPQGQGGLRVGSEREEPVHNDPQHLYRLYQEKVVTPEGKLLARIRQTPGLVGEVIPSRISDHALSPAVGLGRSCPGGTA